jgi:hypothetical protein
MSSSPREPPFKIITSRVWILLLRLLVTVYILHVVIIFLILLDIFYAFVVGEEVMFELLDWAIPIC